MKLHLDRVSGLQTVTGYGAGYVEINRAPIQSSCIVLPDQLIQGWATAGFDGLTEGDFLILASLGPELVVFGSGNSFRFPSPALTASLRAARIGIEVMDTPAACRTYNILSAEGRKVAAALLIA